jgi:hypothetical protein
MYKLLTTALLLLIPVNDITLNNSKSCIYFDNQYGQPIASYRDYCLIKYKGLWYSTDDYLSDARERSYGGTE